MAPALYRSSGNDGDDRDITPDTTFVSAQLLYDGGWLGTRRRHGGIAGCFALLSGISVLLARNRPGI